jgi:hypothetical protein
MTDKKDPVVTTYPLIGEGGKVVPGDQEEQLIDLDAAYKKTGETKTNELVEGLERYINQKILGKREMELAGVKGGENFDPLPSRRNAVLGGESFLTAVKDGFLKIIDFIIKFIKGAVNWVIERIKVLLGFSKTKAEIKACDDARSDMEKEVKSTLSGFGINPSFYSLDQLVESAPRGIDRVEMIKYLSAKSKNETEMAKALTGVIPDLTTLTRKLRDSSDSLTKRYKRFKVVLEDTRKKLAANRVGDADAYELSSRTTLNRLYRSVKLSEESLNLRVSVVRSGITPVSAFAISVSFLDLAERYLIISTRSIPRGADSTS